LDSLVGSSVADAQEDIDIYVGSEARAPDLPKLLSQAVDQILIRILHLEACGTPIRTNCDLEPPIRRAPGLEETEVREVAE
jgi:hypothetical protein